jgi:hypothetical protein
MGYIEQNSSGFKSSTPEPTLHFKRNWREGGLKAGKILIKSDDGKIFKGV